jgi:hypothetical protein
MIWAKMATTLFAYGKRSMENVAIQTVIAKSTIERILFRSRRDCPCIAMLLIGVLSCAPATIGDDANPSLGHPLSTQVIRDAFVANCDGYSTDELLVRDDLRKSFVRDVADRLRIPVDETLERTALLKLLGLRKAGKLNHNATRRAPRSDEAAFPIAEIASRAVMDRHRVTTDTMLADPRLLAELQSEAEKISADVDPYSIRKSVLSLRKRRQLKPELVLKVVDWPRNVQSMRLSTLRQQLADGRISSSPGVYLFRDETGYLYIGEADNLARRLAQHASESDRVSLAQYIAENNADRITVELHVFPKDSPANRVTARRAYESELIRSREPKFNVRP